MAWIESHQELGRHPKTKRLARAASISLPTAVGHLHLIWWWALDYAQDGSLERYTSEDIASAAEWSGDAQQFVEALISAGFIDDDGSGGLSIHDWWEYAGRLLEQRKAQAEYKKRQYALYNDLHLTRAVKQRDGDICQYCGKNVNWNDRRGADGGTYDHIDPDGENTIDNIVVCCRSCNSKKGGKTPREAKMQFIIGGYTEKKPSPYLDERQKTGRNTADISAITVPNQPNPTIPTVPNRTQPNHSPLAGGSGTAGGDEQDPFDVFWKAFPKKVGKGDARRSWAKIKPGKALTAKILTAVETAKSSEQWQREKGRFIPNPATWLNQERWDDEPMKGGDAGERAYADRGRFGQRDTPPADDWQSFRASTGFKRSEDPDE